MESHLRITLLISATWLMMSAVTLKSMVEAQASIGPGLGSGDGDMSDILMPEETVSPSITDASSLMTMVMTSIMQISATSSSTADILILSPSTAEAQAVTSTTPISPATTSRDILPSTTIISLSSAAVNQSVTTLLPTLTSATMLPVSSSSILNTGIETTTIFEDRVITSSMEIFSTFTSTPLTLSATPIPTTTLLSTSVPTSTPLPTTTTMDMITVPTTEPDETGTIASDSSMTAGEGDSTSTSAVDPVDDTRKSVPLSTVNIVIIVIVIVVVLIVVFVIVSCVLAGLLYKRSKKQDPVKREILSNWELQEPPKHGGARLMKIRTLDSMEEIDTAANGIEGSDREQRYQDPSGVEGRNVSNGGNNTAVTFGVPVVVDKTVGKTGETVPESKQQNGSRSETLDNDRGVQNGIKDSANGLKENKVSVVAEAPSTIKETTLTTSTSTFGPAPSLSLNEVKQKPLKTDANDESGAAAIKEMDKQNLVPAKEDAGKAFGAHGLFQDFHEVSTQL